MAYNPYIPWNDEMVVVLLNLVVTEGVHIAKKSEIAKKWNAVNDLFFEQNELLLYKSAYKKDDHRKLRDKYKSELKKIKADIDTGNQSGKSGELSQRYQLVQHCDITARTVLLYVLLCLTYMYCTLYILYILHTVHIVHVSLFPSFPCLSDVEASSSTSVHSYLFTHVHTLLSNHKCTFT